jgi:hypothetical protein
VVGGREHDVRVVVVEQNAGSLAGAALRGGDLVVKGDVGARTGIDQKGGTIIVLGNAASMTGFMMQRGRQIILGNVGHGLGDSCTTARSTSAARSVTRDRLRRGRVDRRRHRAGRAEILDLRARPTAEAAQVRLRKKLYNYDQLEPSERKLVL